MRCGWRYPANLVIQAPDGWYFSIFARETKIRCDDLRGIQKLSLIFKELSRC